MIGEKSKSINLRNRETKLRYKIDSELRFVRENIPIVAKRKRMAHMGDRQTNDGKERS